MLNAIWILLLNFVIWGAGIGLVIYFFNRLNKIISLLEEIKEQNRNKS